MAATERGRTRSRTQQDKFLRLTDDLGRQYCSPGVGIRPPLRPTRCLPLCSTTISNPKSFGCGLLSYAERFKGSVQPARIGCGLCLEPAGIGCGLYLEPAGITTLFGSRCDRGQLRWKRESHVFAYQVEIALVRET